MTPLARDAILRLLERLNDELARDGVCGELCLVGGAVLCLAFDARRSVPWRPSTSLRYAQDERSSSLATLRMNGLLRFATPGRTEAMVQGFRETETRDHGFA